MARLGMIPRRLVCPSCMYEKLSRKPWRAKNVYHHISEAELPGQFVSVDQMESTTPGLIAQMKGILTRERYHYATIFVDHATDYTYVHLQRDTSSEETLRAKKEFERLARSYGITITQYHSDNGRFVDSVWWNDAVKQGQRMKMCGVNAHHQNGKVERRIRQLHDLARTSLLHAIHMWPQAVNTFLWPYAVRKAADDINNIPSSGAGTYPTARFSGLPYDPDVGTKHTFGCPTNILSNELQSGQRIPKWEARSRLAIYIGPSLYNARSIGLGRSLTAGLVSPAFHVKYDDTFATITPQYTTYVPQSLWQTKCGFQKEPQTIELEEISRDNQHETNDTNDINDLLLRAHVDQANNGNDDAQMSMEIDIGTPMEREDVNTEVLDTKESSKRTITRSGREVKLPQRYGNYVTYQVHADSTMYEPEVEYENPISMAATTDPYTMYYHEILNQPDKQKFIEAMVREIEDHNEKQHWRLVRRNTLPPETRVLPVYG
jgi:hypothetical protein